MLMIVNALCCSIHLLPRDEQKKPRSEEVNETTHKAYYIQEIEGIR